MKKDCVFCQIIENKIPSYKILEDSDHLAILDIFPNTEGHTLIITKGHYETIFEIPEEVLAKTNLFVKKVSNLLKKKLKIDGLNIFNSNGKIAQQEIPHYHIHLIPRYKDEKFKIVFENKTKEKNFGEILKKLKE